MKCKKLLFALACSVVLAGCGNGGLEITEDDILEVARDDANATKSECENVSIEKDGSHYNVSFTTSTGSYTYKIGTDGIIQERSYTQSEQEEETSSTTTETKKEETKESETSTSEDSSAKQQAITAALNNTGMTESDATNITCTLSEDGTQYEVSFNAGENLITSTVDASTFAVLSTIVGGQ